MFKHLSTGPLTISNHVGKIASPRLVLPSRGKNEHTDLGAIVNDEWFLGIRWSSEKKMQN